MAKYKVEISGIKTNELKTLETGEMDDLFLRLKNGDLYAKEEIATGNLKLVLSLLKKYNNKNENMDDLFQIGCIGLMKAIENFNSSYGVKFSTYAVPMILGEIRRYIRDNNALRISRSLKDVAYKTLKLKEKIFMQTGREPSNEELSKLLEVDKFEIITALESLKEPISMYEPVYNDGGDTIYLYDQLEDKKSNQNFETKLTIKNAINDLNERERYILDERYNIGKTQVEIANELNISQAQVSRIEKEAIKQLKKTLK